MALITLIYSRITKRLMIISMRPIQNTEISWSNANVPINGQINILRDPIEPRSHVISPISVFTVCCMISEL